MALFCSKHSNSGAPISVICEILYPQDPLKCNDLYTEFLKLGMFEVKDLANSTLAQVNQVSLGANKTDPIAVLYKALELYDQKCKNKFEISFREYENNNIFKSKNICLQLLKHNPQDVHTLMLLAASYFNYEEYNEAESILLKIQCLKPELIEVYRNLGANYWKKCDFEKAINAFSIAARMNFYNYDCWHLFAMALISKTNSIEESYEFFLQCQPNLYIIRYEYANLLLSSNKVEMAKYHCEIIKKHTPEFPLTWNSLGYMCFENNKENAIDHFLKAVDLDPKLTVAWVNLGISYTTLKKYDDALEVFQKALQQDSKNSFILLCLAHTYLKQENIESAIDTLKIYLLTEPDNVNVNYVLGKLYINYLKNGAEAIKYLEKCMDVGTEEFYINLIKAYIDLNNIKRASKILVLLGDMYSDQNNKENAMSAYISAIYINPDNARGHWKLGRILYQLGHFDLAVMRYRTSLELKPNQSDVYCDVAKIYEINKIYKKALLYYNMSISTRKNNYTAIHNLIKLNHKLGNYNETIRLNYKLLKNSQSDIFEVHLDLANTYYYKKGNLINAFKHYIRALAIDNTNTNTQIILGNILLEWKLYEKALHCYNNAISLDPKSVIAHTNIGIVHKNKKNFKEAIKSFELALQLQPDYPDAYCNLMPCYRHICDWQNYDFLFEKLKDIILKQINDGQLPSLLPHDSLYYPLPSEVLKNIALKNAEKCIEILNKETSKFRTYEFPVSLTLDGCINVGYVSSNFGNHPLTQLMQSIPNLHNRNKIKVFCYALSSNDHSKPWDKISSESDCFKDISTLNATDAANTINQDGIHILINMNGYTDGAKNEIFALRPAPIQVLWLGYPGTSGATFIDYLITDKVCSPPEFNHYYTENLVYLNQSVYIGDHKQLYDDLKPRISNQNKSTKNLKTTFVLTKGHPSIKTKNGNQSIPPTDILPSIYSIKPFEDDSTKLYTRSQYSLPEDAVVYCNFGQLYKIDPPTFNMWATILINVPNSVLWLLKFPEAGAKQLLKTTSTLNVDPSRIIFGNVEPISNHLKRIQLADIFLDTSICNGHTTCLDVLWAGVPIVTLPGETFASRVAASQLTTLGCTDTVAQNKEQYIEIAIQLGKDKMLLESLRSKIWTLRTTSKLFDCKSYTEELEIIYEDMWKKYSSENSLDK